MTTNKIEQELYPGVPEVGQKVIVKSKENPEYIMQDDNGNNKVFDSVIEAIRFLNSHGFTADDVNLVDVNTNLIL